MVDKLGLRSPIKRNSMNNCETTSTTNNVSDLISDWYLLKRYLDPIKSFKTLK